jgi:hypothetical protein
MQKVRLAKSQDQIIELRVLAGAGREDDLISARLTADALTGATSLVVLPLSDALASGDKLLFGENTVVTLTGAAAAGVTSLAVSALAGPLRSGDVGRKLQDLTGYTIEAEILTRRGDATPLISLTGADITLATQTGDDRGKVQIGVVAADTTSLTAGNYYGAAWRRNAGTSRPLVEFEVELVEAGFLS